MTMTIEEIQSILADPTAALLKAAGIPRICPRLDKAVGIVLRDLTGDDVPVWDDWMGGGEVLQVDFPRQDEHGRSVLYYRYPRPDGGYRYAVDIAVETWVGDMFHSDLRPNVRTDDQFGKAIWPLPY